VVDNPVAVIRLLIRFSVTLLAAGSAACASSGAVPRPFPLPGDAQPSAARPAARSRPGGSAIVSEALSLQGVPYRNGGSDPSGFDCSGFVWYVFGRQGVGIPRTVAAQFGAGQAVDADDLEPGDLVFFETAQSPASHVGVVIDADRFVHAPSSRGEVRVERLSAPYWSRRFAGARRLH
jgi:cell wall-associated NlpC family hydrolase